MNLIDLERGLIGSFGIIGGSIGAATGAGLSARRQGRVAVAFFGDGTTNQGYFWECLNFAKVLELPVVYVCENNQWAISTPVAAATRISNIADRAAAYGFPGVVADGNDVLEMQSVTAQAVARARDGDGPTLIEAKSYRITPHSAATQTDLRDPGELDEWRARDPILRYARHLADEVGIEPGRLEALEQQATQEVEAAIEAALESLGARLRA
jgi:TPP-dependent pyruvate/acetoin dehydrogenase alpha subunit